MTAADRLAVHGTRLAIVSGGASFTYRDLHRAADEVARTLLAARPDLDEARVALLAPPGFDYAAVLLGIWRAGGVAVPLAVSHPPAELEYVIRDSDASVVVAAPELRDRVAAVAGRLTPAPTSVELQPTTTPITMRTAAPVILPNVSADRRALMLYTSGTTGSPKGVVTTHRNIAAQITSLVEAWEWRADDRALLALPLDHVHGLINVVGCALWVGAACEMLPRFDAEAVWDRLASGQITVFTAVPTIYHRLIASWDAAPDLRRARSDGCRQTRLMMSGSAALPLRVLERWREITGHVLLERYGMTEIGMALANPLRGDRRPGHVGQTLPGVEIRLVDDQGAVMPAGCVGEIEVRGDGVFGEYWRRPDDTREAFRDGWFRTGDLAVLEDGSYRLLGRTSVDIIKTGGHKVSALEIEDVLRDHAAVADCAVVGVDDAEWGQRVCVAVELRTGAALSLDELDAWARVRLAPYKIPKTLRTVACLPRNAMGKVVKPDVAALCQKP